MWHKHNNNNSIQLGYLRVHNINVIAVNVASAFLNVFYSAYNQAMVLFQLKNKCCTFSYNREISLEVMELILDNTFKTDKSDTR